jgi:hypothetical protein
VLSADHVPVQSPAPLLLLPLLLAGAWLCKEAVGWQPVQPPASCHLP